MKWSNLLPIYFCRTFVAYRRPITVWDDDIFVSTQDELKASHGHIDFVADSTLIKIFGMAVAYRIEGAPIPAKNPHL